MRLSAIIEPDRTAVRDGTLNGRQCQDAPAKRDRLLRQRNPIG